MEQWTAIFAGFGLAAACGFRVFAPLFMASLAANPKVELFEGIPFREWAAADFEWLGGPWVTLALGVATAAEIGAYYVPWIDNLLDSIASPAAIVAGTLTTGTAMPEFVGDGAGKWILSTVAGGGTAGLVQGASVLTRGASSASTGGLGNPAVATAELGGAVGTAALAILLPVLAALVVLPILFFGVRTIIRRRRAKRAASGAG